MTVNAERYLRMLIVYLFPKLVENGMGTFHFQQNGATCHAARILMAALRNRFPGKLISKFGDIDWRSRSPDVTFLDFHLRGYLKSKVYFKDPRRPKIKHKERNKQHRFCNYAECHGLDGRKDAKMLGCGWRTFKV